MDRVPTVLVALSALIFAGIGAWCIVDPVGALEPVGLAPASELGLVEARAMYGGLQLGMAAFLAWTLRAPERVRIGLLAATLSIGGLGGARLLAWLALQPEGALMPMLCAIELGGAVAGALALWTTRRG